MSHDEFDDLASLAALDLLRDEELLRWQTHRKDCEPCRIAEQQALEAVGLLALTLDPVAPPTEVGESVMRKTIRAENDRLVRDPRKTP